MDAYYTLIKIMNAPSDSHVVIDGCEHEVFILGLFQGEQGESFIDAVYPLNDQPASNDPFISQPARAQAGFEALCIGGQYRNKYDRRTAHEGAGRMPFMVF